MAYIYLLNSCGGPQSFIFKYSYPLLSTVLCPHFPKSNVLTFQIFGILGEQKEMVSDLKLLLIRGVKSPRHLNLAFFCCCIFSLCFNIFLPPFPSQSPMSKLVRSSELLGKLNGNKRSQTWKLFLINGVKSLRRKKLFFFFYQFCLTSRIFFSIGATICIVWEMLCLPYTVYLFNILSN